MISKEEVKYMASLAKIEIKENELEKLANSLSKTVEYVEILDDLDMENLEPLYQVYDYNQVLRKDKVEEGLTREEVLQNTEEKQYGYFKLLNIMD